MTNQTKQDTQIRNYGDRKHHATQSTKTVWYGSKQTRVSLAIGYVKCLPSILALVEARFLVNFLHCLSKSHRQPRFH